jgi:outer membrane phospholipase A
MQKLFRKAIAAATIGLVAQAANSADRDQCLSRHDSGGGLNQEPVLCSYEPTTLGWTKDGDDVGFMDFKLSVRYQIYPFPGEVDRWATYFAFTGRFAQYLGTRDSSPVVTKRLNPKVFYRQLTAAGGYFDVGYNHESNGQAINTLDGFEQAKATALAKDGSTNAAFDQISRGWDYLDFVWKKPAAAFGGDGYLVLKYFLPTGLLQGKAEEYGTNFSESDPEGKPRRQVNGVSALYKKKLDHCDARCKVFFSYETGYSHFGQYNTFRAEFGYRVPVLQLPLTVWWQSGYNSDLAQYYKKVSSAGIAVEIGSF